MAQFERDMPSGARDERFNVALARGLAILRAFHVGATYLGNAELARRVGIPKATVSRMTYTLTQLGYLRYAEDVDKYEIAPGVLALGYAFLAKTNIHVVARPLMSDFARESNTVVSIGMLDRNYVVALEYAKGSTVSFQETAVGFSMPVARTAIGWACMAAMPVAERERLLNTLKQVYASKFDTLRSKIEHALVEVAQRGFCCSIGTYEKRNNAIGVPLVVPGMKYILALNCYAPERILTPQSMSEIWGPKLVKLARAIKRGLLEE
ncbi:MAG TPA: IclR family transcriptional regulator [Lacipirellula sp.]|jgi:DNA-binding IclR family transcriptional regulator